MRENEKVLEGKRGELWADFGPEEEESWKEGEVWIEGKGMPSEDAVGEVREDVERVGWLSR